MSIPTGTTALVAGDNRKIVVPIGTRLMPGTYNVAWHAVSVDTHRVSGSYSFKVMR
jgi:methionine-rich copper-binding protein CopC